MGGRAANVTFGPRHPVRRDRRRLHVYQRIKTNEHELFLNTRREGQIASNGPGSSLTGEYSDRRRPTERRAAQRGWHTG
jgi:hypothetical protein